MNKMFPLILALAGLSPVLAQAQKADFNVALSKQVAKPGDTLHIEAQYTIGSRQLPPATLDVIVENKWGNTWNLRWPLIEGKASVNIILPKNLPLGKYDISLAVQPRFLRLYGQILYSNKKKINVLQATVISDNGERNSFPLSVDPVGNFVMQDQLIYDNVIMSFSTGNNKDILDIHPDAWLDSAYNPVATQYLAMLISDHDTSIAAKILPTEKVPAAWTGPMAYKNYTKFQLFNAFYCSGAFRNDQEWLVDALSDSSTVASSSNGNEVLDKLAKEGIVIQEDEKTLVYKGKTLQLFLDEQPINITLLKLLDTRRLAGIELFQPIPASNANGQENNYRLAVYSKRYPFVESENVPQHYFYIKGYAKASTQLIY